MRFLAVVCVTANSGHDDGTTKSLWVRALFPVSCLVFINLRRDHVRSGFLEGLPFIKANPAIDGDRINLTGPKIVDIGDY